MRRASRGMVAILMAGLTGVWGTCAPMVAYAGDGGLEPVPLEPVGNEPVGMPQRNVPSVGYEQVLGYVMLTPEEVEALYSDTATPDLSGYYVHYIPKAGNEDEEYIRASEYVPSVHGYVEAFDDAYGTHEGEDALFRWTTEHVTQTGSGTTDLTMILESSGEFGGTDEPIVVPADEPGTGHYDENGDPQDGGDYELNPYYNPDENGDDLGDNLAFTVPSAINYVVKADGRLIGPEEGAAYIENESTFAAHVSSLDVDEQSPFHIVESTMNSDATNAVELVIGSRGSLLNAYDYLDKSSVGVAADWNMEASADGTADQVPLLTGGTVANITADISTTTKFGEIHWYVTPGAASEGVPVPMPIGHAVTPTLNDVPQETLFAWPTGPIYGGVAEYGYGVSINGSTFKQRFQTWDDLAATVALYDGLTWDDIESIDIWYY